MTTFWNNNLSEKWSFVKNYIILDGIEGCMRIYWEISSWLVQYILIQSEIKPLLLLLYQNPCEYLQALHVTLLTRIRQDSFLEIIVATIVKHLYSLAVFILGEKFSVKTRNSM